MEFTFTQEPQDTVTVQGGALQLDCQAQSDAAVGPPSITWRKDGVLLSTLVDERRRQLANGSLLVQNVMHSRHHRPDEGEYQCLATLDGLGSIVSRVARVSVAGKRRQSQRPIAHIHTSLHLEMSNYQARGHPGVTEGQRPDQRPGRGG